MTTAELLAQQFADTRDWTRLLIADLQGDDWTFQPGPGLHHALWLCGHLATSQDTLIFDRCLGRTGELDAVFRAHFPLGVPVASAQEHSYPSPREVLDQMESMNVRTLEAIRGMSDGLLAEPAYAKDGKSRHPHYENKLGAVTHLSRHEAFHAGQIALLRRLLGKPALR